MILIKPELLIMKNRQTKKSMKRLVGFICGMVIIASCTISSKTKGKNLNGDQIVENFIEARGGIDKLQDVKTLKMIIEAPEIKFIAESYRRKPDKVVDIMKYPNWEIKMVLNGKKAISKNPNGTESIQQAVTLRNMHDEALIFPELYRKKLGYIQEYIGLEKINGKDYYKVKVVLPDSAKHIEYYDIQTDLLYKLIDEFELETIFEEYQEIDGIKFLKYFKAVNTKETIHFIVKELTINPELDEKIFSIENTATNPQ
jgi:hypothetical protein